MPSREKRPRALWFLLFIITAIALFTLLAQAVRP